MIDKKLTAYLAELGKIGLTESELAEMTEDMKSIIALMDKVRELGTDEKPYTSGAVGYEDLRADESRKTDFDMEHNNRFNAPKVV